MHCNTIIVIRDFKVADYGWLRRLDVSSVDWVEYRLGARKFNACCPLRFRRQTEDGG